MIVLYDFLTFIICTCCVVGSLARIRKQIYNVLDVGIVVYWMMQVLPIPVQYICTLHAVEIGIWRNMYLAMSDFWTGAIYDFITTITIIIMSIICRRLLRTDKGYNIESIKSVINQPFMKILVIAGIFVPMAVAVVFAPDPKIYFTYSYFYTNVYNKMSVEYLYHANIVNRLCFVSILFIIIQYFSRNQRRIVENIYNIDILIAILLCTWINGKRAVLIFILFGILSVDFLDSTNSYKKILKKTMVFVTVSIAYFALFSFITGKQSESDFFDLYNMYFSRLGCEKLAIYDQLYTNKMLEFPGQTILYDLLFFVPREIWPDKPSFFATYFTGYAYFGDGSHFLPDNLLVNIWTEFYANFGFFGHFFALSVVILMAKKAEKSSSFFVYLSTTFFLVSYMSFGFEFIVLIIYVVMIVFWIKEAFGKRVQLK